MIAPEHVNPLRRESSRQIIKGFSGTGRFGYATEGFCPRSPRARYTRPKTVSILQQDQAAMQNNSPDPKPPSKREYPPVYEKWVPILLAGMVIALVIIVIVAIAAVALGGAH